MSYYETVLDTPEMQRVRENQKNFSLVSFLLNLKHNLVVPEIMQAKHLGILPLRHGFWVALHYSVLALRNVVFDSSLARLILQPQITAWK